MGDTLGIGFSLVGLILMGGFTFTSLKLFLVIVFLWFSSPASSHLIARLEVTTDEEPEKHYRTYTIRELEEKLHGSEESAEQTGEPGRVVRTGGEPSDALPGKAVGTGERPAQEEA